MHQVQHHPKIDSLPLPASFSSLGGYCTQLSTFPQLQVNQWIESQLPSRLPPNRPPLSTPPISLDHSLQVHLQTRSVTASECISKLDRSRPPSASPNSLDHGLKVHHWVNSTSASKFISQFIRSPSPSASQTRSIMYIFKERRRFDGATGVTEVDRVTGSIYSADPGADRHHLISISCYHTMKIHTLSFPTFGLTRSVRDPRNCVDPHGRVVSSLLTSLRSSSLM